MADREKAIMRLQILRTWCAVNPDFGMGLDPGDCAKAVGWLDDAIELLKAQEPRPLTVERAVPAVDAVPVVHAYWIDCSECNDGTVCRKCSACKDMQIHYRTYYPNFCPECGAKMDGERRDDNGSAD